MTSKIAPARFLILSDIHFGRSSFSPDFAPLSCPPKSCVENAISMKGSLIERVKGLGADKAIDALLVPGDMTSFALPSEFKGCFNVIKDIAASLNIKEENIFLTSGNHDIDWRVSRLGDAEDWRDPMYKEVAPAIGSLIVSNNGDCVPGPYPFSGVWFHSKFKLFVINSSYYCTHDQPFQHGKIGHKQLEWLRESLNTHMEKEKWNIVMMHHHPMKYSYPNVSVDISCAEEGSELMDMFGEFGVDLVLHGHRHHPILFTNQRSGWKSPVTFLCSGSLAVSHVDRNYGEIPNTFHIITLTERLKYGGAFGDLLTFKYSSHSGWQESVYDKALPLDHEQYFGNICPKPEVKTRLTAIVDDAMKEQSENVIEMPQYGVLPNDLKCVQHHVLNELLSHIAVAKNLMISGSYPGNVLLKVVR